MVVDLLLSTAAFVAACLFLAGLGYVVWDGLRRTAPVSPGAEVATEHDGQERRGRIRQVAGDKALVELSDGRQVLCAIAELTAVKRRA